MSVPQPVTDDAGPVSAGDHPAEIAGELHRSLAGYMEWVVTEWRRTLAQVEKKQAGYVPPGERDDLAALREHTRFALDAFERIREHPARLDHLAPADFDWRHLAAEVTRDEAAGLALWKRICDAAREELERGMLRGQALEGYHARPYERATYLVIREALADGLQPRNGMERLLVDGMAEAWALHLRWLGRHSETDSVEAMRVERDVRQRGAWEPPRLSDAEAVDRAALMADRFQRQFLRLMKCYRDGRRLIGSMTVLGGQVNVAEQQVVANGVGAQLGSSPRLRSDPE
jgi:hypothetical protein